MPNFCVQSHRTWSWRRSETSTDRVAWRRNNTAGTPWLGIGESWWDFYGASSNGPHKSNSGKIYGKTEVRNRWHLHKMGGKTMAPHSCCLTSSIFEAILGSSQLPPRSSWASCASRTSQCTDRAHHDSGRKGLRLYLALAALLFWQVSL